MTDEITKGRRKTTYRMTKDDARERFGEDARKVEWTREVRVVDLPGNATGSFIQVR